MISHAHRCIFVHVPRCGGTSIESVLWPGPRTETDLWMGFVSPLHNTYQTGGLQHLLAEQIRREVGSETFDAYHKFAIVRNPWDKAVSQYRHMQRRPDLRAFVGMRADDGFRTYLRLIARTPHVQWRPQHAFVCGEDGTLLVDELGRFETFERDVARIFRRFGFDAEVPHLNASDRGPLGRYYDEETLALVGELYREDVERFSYRPPTLAT